MGAREISLTLPLSQAIDRVKLLLFRPFNPGKWFVIGFCAWLAQLGQSGFGGSSGYRSHGRGGAPNLQHWLHQARDFVLANLWWIIPVAAVVVLFSVALWLLVLWVSSRGQFMFLHCVALDKAEVRVPWHKFVCEANSLFRFRLVLGLIGAVWWVPVAAGIALLVISMITQGTPTLFGVLGVISLVLLAAVLGLAWLVVAKLTRDFVVPIQFARGGTCREGWRVLSVLLCRNVGNFVLYFLFQILIAIAIAVLVLGVVLLTCCVAGCLFAIPYLGTVLLLPILVFHRSYSIYYLAQYGKEYAVIADTVQT